MDTNVSPVKPCHLLTAKRRLAVTVMMAGDVRPGWVLAATWVTGELDGNFNTMITSCCICSVNISGVCRRRYCSGPKRVDNGMQGREEKSQDMERQTKRAKIKRRGKQPQPVLARKKSEGEGEKRRKERKLGSLSRIADSSNLAVQQS